MLKLFNRLFASSDAVLFAPGVSERFARMLMDKNNPDHILVAHVLQSFATEFDSWVLKQTNGNFLESKVGLPKNEHFTRKRDEYLLLSKKDFEITISLSFVSCEYTEHISSIKVKNFTINGLSINNDLGYNLLQSFMDLRKKHMELRAAADKAKAEMEANEKKWNLVENVLGLKRLEDGTLVAKQSAE